MVRKKFTFLKVSRKSRRNLRLNWPWRIEICGDPRPSFRILVLCGFWVWWHIIRSNLIKFLVVIFFQVTMMHWAAGEEAHCVKLVSAHHYHHLGNSSSSRRRSCLGRRLPHRRLAQVAASPCRRVGNIAPTTKTHTGQSGPHQVHYWQITYLLKLAINFLLTSKLLKPCSYQKME